MTELRSLEGETIAGLQWWESGQSAISGRLLDALETVDGLFARMAARFQAEPVCYPELISAEQLDRIDYFQAFPQLFTAAVGLAPDDANLRSFTSGGPVQNGILQLTRLAPPREILTPAACYPIYISERNRELPERRTFTVRSRCHRRERHYRPLERQWSFSMREIVCIGTGQEVREFLTAGNDLLDQLFGILGLGVTWTVATDPFFDPRNPQALMQKVDPVKREMLIRGLAIGSTNYHRHHFGDAFRITRDGAALESGCIAFGLERWLRILIELHGADPHFWPRLDAIGWPS